MSNLPDGYIEPIDPMCEDSGDIEFTCNVTVVVDEYGEIEITAGWEHNVEVTVHESGLELFDLDNLVSTVEDAIYEDDDLYNLSAGTYTLQVPVEVDYSIYDLDYGPYEGDYNTYNAFVDSEIYCGPITIAN